VEILTAPEEVPSNGLGLNRRFKSSGRSSEAKNSRCMEPHLLGIKKKGVTVQLLWMEHKVENPEGYQYSLRVMIEGT
jgi:hypothetical protein